MRKCACGNPLPQQLGAGRPRTKCDQCRSPTNAEIVLVPRVPLVEPALVRLTRRDLEAAERLNTPRGALAMDLALVITAGGHTAAGLASLSKSYREALADALQGSRGATDAVSDLDTARRARIAGA